MDRAGDPNTTARAASEGAGDSGEWLAGGGETGDLVRSLDWSATPLGPREAWPQSLRTAVGMVLASRFPMALLWGRALTFVHNDACRPVAGGKHPGALGRSARDVWPEVGGHVNEPIFAAVLDRGETVYLEDACFPIDRHGYEEQAYFTLCCSPVRVESGEVGGALVTLQETTSRLAERERLASDRERMLAHRDVTELERSEQALRASEARLNAALEAAKRERDFTTAVVDTAGALVIVMDRDGRITRFNRECERVTGYRAGAVEGRPLWDVGLIPPEQAERVRAVWDSLAGGAFPSAYENHWVARDGSRRLIAWSNTVICGAGGEVQFIVGTGVDITERRRAEAALRASEEKFRSVFEQAAIGMGRVRFDDARWIDVNDAFCRILGRTRDEMLRTPWPEITHPEDVDRDLVPFRKMAAGQLESYTVEKRFLHADGRHVWAKLTLSLVRGATGRPEYEIAIIEDIGERKAAEQQLRASKAQLEAERARLEAAQARLQEADRRKDEFLGMLSHELRNPLAPIRNALYILDRAAEPSGPEARRAREVASRQVAHLTRLVDDLLDVTRIARGKIELRQAALDLAALARRTAEDHRQLMQERHVDLVLDVPERPVVVNGDETRLAQVLGNLLHNAAKFTPGGGRVTLSVAVEGERGVIRVRDTGAGLEPEMLEAVFEPFTQAKQTLARSEGGLGLGLALVKGLVALHGGEVTASSDGPGRGTEFAATLPLAAADPARSTATPGAAGRSGAGHRRVLVIDDNHDAADSLAQLVAMMGHEVDVAYDAFDALARAAGASPDVVLCDIGLPGMDGYEFARQFRAVASRRSARLVAVSGYAQPEDVARSLDAGFDAHVAKPPDPERIAALITPGEEPAGALRGESRAARDRTGTPG